MKSAILSYKNRGQLSVENINKPNINANEVLIDIHSASLNPHDWKFYQQFSPIYKMGLAIPNLLIGHDLSGTVIATGKNVDRFKIGDDVYGMSAKTGAFSEFASVNQKYLAIKPSNLNHSEAASIPMAALTALQALKQAGIKEGDEVLVIGGSGGVGVFAVQIAKILKAKVTTVCSTANVDWVKDLGADSVIDYKKEDLTQTKNNFDIIFDTIGNESRHSCQSIIKDEGFFITTHTNAKFIALSIKERIEKLFSRKAITNSTLLAMPRHKDLEKFTQWVESNEMTTVVDKTFKLDDIHQAVSYSQTGRTKGKIAITMDKTVCS